ncbi:MAG: CoB--CoM heterodisulfide reductase iron-sulfur subunit A family protein, partial [Deltaproteobacteria bacterium]|nr:CoB--CoM heterodisulfide reductase iron-sulfur subunit A family protein [Deltaproteobacteria bacterium]
MNNTGYGKDEPVRDVLVIGGGVAGISAAIGLEERGAIVHLVEKKRCLGGTSFEWACMATDACQNCGACLSAEMAGHADHLQNVHIYLETEISEVQRTTEKFQVALKGRNSCILSVDAVLLATGFEPFDASTLESLKYPVHDRVITTQGLNRLIKKERLADLFLHRESPRLAFIQCVGSRNREQGRDYCSQVCCKVALRQANKIIDLYPSVEVSIFYMDLQIIGKEFRSQFSRIRNRVKLIQGVPAEILTDHEPGRLTVIQEDDESGERIAHHFDTVVLSIGMVPALDSLKVGKLFETRTDQWGFFGGRDAALPNGVYTAGAAAGPMDILSAKEQGLIAAHNIARDLGILPDFHSRPSVAILGDGEQGIQVARSLSLDRYSVKLLDTGDHEVGSEKYLDYFPDTRLLAVTGAVGQFSITMNSDNEIRSIDADAIIVATGVERKPISVHGS